MHAFDKWSDANKWLSENSNNSSVWNGMNDLVLRDFSSPEVSGETSHGINVTTQASNTAIVSSVEIGESLKAVRERTDNTIVIYTDGSAFKNGRKGAVAGVGVFFGANNKLNISEPLEGEKQTNQRAELTAIKRALDVAPTNRKLIIYSDSKYSIQCITVWYKNWIKNNWRTMTGGAVDNTDIIKAILAKIDSRRASGQEIKFLHVRGHKGIAGNEAVDKLAKAGARRSGRTY
ncbi:ribonuclease H-like domain-containing protein [Dipodascopsis uninucleata]